MTQRISFILSAAAIFFGSGFFSSSSLAQQQVAPAQAYTALETQVAPQLYPKRSIQHEGVLNSDSMPFYVVRLDSDWADVSNGNEYTYSCEVFNTTSNPLTIYFLRSQQLPVAWVTSVCWGTTCYANGDSTETYTLAPNDSAGLQLNVTPVLTDYPDSSKVWLRVGVVDSVADSVQLVFYSGFKPGNPPIIFQWSAPILPYSFSGSGLHTMSNNILENRSGVSTKYYFSLQDSLPSGWSAQYCVSTNCTSEAKDSSVFEPFGTTANSGYQQRVEFKLNEPVLIKKDSAVFYLAIHPNTENPADSANYRFVAVVNTHLLENSSPYSFISGSPNTITTQFKNLLTIPDSYHFSLKTSLPSGWSIQSYCIGDSCSSGTEIINSFDATGGTNAIQNVTFTLQTEALLTHSDTGILYLSSYPVDNTGDMRIDTIYAIANPLSGVAGSPDVTNAGLAVTNAWPNPVYGSGNLTLDILTDVGGDCRARIYDIAGVEQANVDLGTLHVGANEAQISNLNLRSGEYIIRIEQGGNASEVIRINYIR